MTGLAEHDAAVAIVVLGAVLLVTLRSLLREWRRHRR